MLYALSLEKAKESVLGSEGPDALLAGLLQRAAPGGSGTNPLRAGRCTCESALIRSCFLGYLFHTEPLFHEVQLFPTYL